MNRMRRRASLVTVWKNRTAQIAERLLLQPSRRIIADQGQIPQSPKAGPGLWLAYLGLVDGKPLPRTR